MLNLHVSFDILSIGLDQIFLDMHEERLTTKKILIIIEKNLILMD